MSQSAKTDLAQKYTHPVNVVDNLDHNPIGNYDPFKSGMTPIDQISDPTFPELEGQERLEKYQRSRFDGFTTSELKIMKCLAFFAEDSGNMRLDWNVPIHQIFQRPNWLLPTPKHEAPFPLGKGRFGFWKVDTLNVWNAIEPSLKIATVILESTHSINLLLIQGKQRGLGVWAGRCYPEDEILIARSVYILRLRPEAW
ncbi:uncharacterized protein PAC_08658 [Phialocephala subalpina]|uniref:Uncharacterized protein n=1 Tax=Phialocephala subalpina TaxID=576137 RepID=A0A1L7X173_9HELO|nr:uncharacterized protein PAC_08658 [Phialocephala subalpina]